MVTSCVCFNAGLLASVFLEAFKPLRAADTRSLWVQMAEELIVACLGTLMFSCVVFFPLRLQGSWLLFWLAYFCTLSIGIGAPPFLCSSAASLERSSL